MSEQLPICPRCQEPTEREAGAVGYEMERRPTRVTMPGTVIPGADIAVRKRRWRCLRCEKVWAVPEAEVKEKRNGGGKTTRRKRGNIPARSKRKRVPAKA